MSFYNCDGQLERQVTYELTMHTLDSTTFAIENTDSALGSDNWGGVERPYGCNVLQLNSLEYGRVPSLVCVTPLYSVTIPLDIPYKL